MVERVPNHILMGVSACGKTTLGRALAEALGARFVDADDHHSAANKAKMAAGQPLTDEDRAPWLADLRDLLGDHAGADDTPLVLACSALKRAYRAPLRAADPAARWIFLEGDRATLLARLQGRSHFFPASLLDSQLATLEPPVRALRVPITLSPDEQIMAILTGLRRLG